MVEAGRSVPRTDRGRNRTRNRWLMPRSSVVLLGAVLVIVALAGTAPSTAGQNFYAAPGGSPRNPGSLSNPLDLATALSSASPAGPGDTIWVRGGTYRGAFTSVLNGTATQPIIVRNYNGERVTIDHRVAEEVALDIAGQHTWVWGVEVTSGGSKRRNASMSMEGLDRGHGVRNTGSYNKLVNCSVHDAGNGIGNWGTWANWPGFEVYGCLVYYNGWEVTSGDPPGRGGGHGIYTLSKKTGATALTDNIVFANSSQGIRVGDDGVFNPRIEGNISYLNGTHLPNWGGRNLYVGGQNDQQGHVAYEPMTDAVVKDNLTYYPTNPDRNHGPGDAGSSEGLNFGLWWPGASGQIVGNYLAGFGGGYALGLGYWDSNDRSRTTCSGNTVVGTYNAYVEQQCPPGSNVFHNQKPAHNAVFVRANQFERGRAHVAVYNWENLPAVSVSVSDVGLQEGQRFEVRDAMNFYESPVATGTYRRTASQVTIPMRGLTRAPMTGEADTTPGWRPQHSAPEFGAFVVVPR